MAGKRESSQPGHLGLGNHPSEEDGVEQARVWISRLPRALCARRNVWTEDVSCPRSSLSAW
jgi:hypothetical protein